MSEPAESTEPRVSAKGNPRQPTVHPAQEGLETSNGLERIRQAAIRDPDLRFTSLLHHVTTSLLLRSYGELNPKATPGVDDVTWRAYGENLLVRLDDLHERIHRGTYRAKPSKRLWLEKDNGKLRPIGIACLEDKIVQQALRTVLQQIYEVDFLGFSYGFRPGRGCHNALDALYVAITQRKVNWILDADIKGFFDTIDHRWLMKILEHRIADRRVLRLVRKFLRAGVSDDGDWSRTEVGTPQGAVISPLLANVYLHYVLDLWVQQWRKRHARGEVYIVRYADDFVVCFQQKADADTFYQMLKERFAKFGLELSEEKTRLLRFGRFAETDSRRKDGRKPETFNFLGFTHVCGRRRSDGKFALHRRTIASRVRRKLKEIKAAMKRCRDRPVKEQAAWLRSVLMGYFRYYAVPGNLHTLKQFHTEVVRLWYKTLKRRSQKTRKAMWAWLTRQVRRWLPRPKVMHPYPNQRLTVTT